MRKSFSFTAFASLFTLMQAAAQNVAINNDASLPTIGAILDVKSSSKGILIPRVALTGTDDIITIPNRVESLLVYNNATISGSNAVSAGFYYWSGVNWVRLTSNTSSLFSGWLLGGNGGTSPSLHFIGTNDNNSLLFKVNNQKAGYLGVEPNDGNVFWGYQSGNNNAGHGNVGIGIKALFNNTSSSNLVAVGDSALYSNTTGTYNTAIGSKALFSNANGVANTAVGAYALYLNTYGSFNAVVGYGALATNTGGERNTASGYFSMNSNVTGNYNTANGFYSLGFNTTGKYNTASGAEAMIANGTGDNNSAYGYRSLYLNSTGQSNIGIGVKALYNNTTSSNLVAIGDSALFSNTSGSNNSAVGSKSLNSNSSGWYNSAHGFQALYGNTTGFWNTAQGNTTLYKNTSGSANTANGASALYNNNGSDNTAAGLSALWSNTTGIENTAVGVLALYYNVAGNDNTAIGHSASTVVGLTLNNATAIGAHTIVGCSDCLVLGNYANVGIGESYPGFPLSFASNVGDKISLYGNTGAHYGLGIQGGLLQLHADQSTSDIAFGYGSSATFSENMRIKGNGNLRLGATNGNATLTFGGGLSEKIILFAGVSGNAGFGVFGNELRIHSDYSGADITFGYDLPPGYRENMRITGAAGNLLVRGSVTASSSFYTSDIRLKKDIQPIVHALEKITQLQGYNYFWLDEEQDHSLQSGVIAQEVQKTFPELVRADNKGMLSVNYVGLIPYVIQSIKEQNNRIEQLAKENEELQKVKNEVAELKKMVQQLSAK